MDAAHKRYLGRVELEVTQIGFGAAPLGNLYAALSEEEAHATVQAAHRAGIRYFDTAPLYGHGWSEHRLGEALRAIPRADYVLSTKVGRTLHAAPPGSFDGGLFRPPMPFKPEFDYSYDGVMRSFEDSLQRLGTNHVEILFIHDVDVWTHGSDEGAQARLEEVMAGGYKALTELREQGVVKAIGAGLNQWEWCEKFAYAGDFDCFLLAGRYTLLEQEALDSFLPFCEERDIAIIIGGPYNTGILATGAVEGAMYNYAPAEPDVMARVAQIERVCAAHGVKLASAALQFPLLHPCISSVIPGARTPDEVTRNIETFAVEIPDALWADLKAEGLLRPDAPTP